MNRHPYLRAYMAGILLPSWFLLVVLAAFLFGHITGRVPPRIETAIVFPMAIVPNLWGLWNVLYTRLALRRRLPIGAFGSLLPFLLVPAGAVLASVVDLNFYTPVRAVEILPVAMGIYYLAWKYGVAFFNKILDPR
jgi:hypothetical protein